MEEIPQNQDSSLSQKQLKSLGLYEKVLKIRLELRKVLIKKSGKNTFSNYHYFELEEIIKAVEPLMEKYRVLSVFKANQELATFSLIDIDEICSRLHFSLPFTKAQIGLKKDGSGGASDIQNIGGASTFLRRYLYINAFDIIETDAVEFDAKKSSEKSTKKDYSSLIKEFYRSLNIDVKNSEKELVIDELTAFVGFRANENPQAFYEKISASKNEVVKIFQKYSAKNGENL
jgi:hypothetical protein